MLKEFVRLVREGGIVAATVHEEIWHTGGFKAEIESLKAQKSVEVVRESRFGIIEDQDAGAIMLVMKRF